MPIMQPATQYTYHPNLLDVVGYDGSKFIDKLNARFGLRNDAALCRVIHVNPAVVSKIRHHRLGISAEMLLRLHEVTEIPLNELRQMMGAPLPTIPKISELVK